MRYLFSILLGSLLAFSLHAAEATIIGKWYDDVGSPSFLDATFIVEEEGGTYFLNRRNGDGSGGRYKLDKKGSTYFKIGDKFGAHYKVTAKGLELRDSAGFIRLARPLK